MLPLEAVGTWDFISSMLPLPLGAVGSTLPAPLAPSRAASRTEPEGDWVREARTEVVFEDLA